MKKFIHNTSAAIITLAFSAHAVAQSTGDFRTAQDGAWATVGTWETFDGAIWNPAGSAPTSADGAITILNTHDVTVGADVTVDQVTVNSGGTLTINSGFILTLANGSGTELTIDLGGMVDVQGTLAFGGIPNKTASVSGILRSSGTISGSSSTKLTFNSGGAYEHNFTTTAGTIPTATWNSASTCSIIGYTTNTTVTGGLTQSFGNFVWNCPSQSDAISLDGNLTDVNGNLTISSTGSGTVFLSNTTTFTLNVDGNFVYDDGVTGVISTSGTGTINVLGNFTMANSAYLQMAETGSATMTIDGNMTISGVGTPILDFSAGTGVGTINLKGNLTLSAASGDMQNTSTIDGSALFNFAGTSSQMYSVTPTLTQKINYTVNSGAILTMGVSDIIKGTGSFTLASGGTLQIASTDGIRSTTNLGPIQVSGTRTYNTAANYVYNGSSAQITGNGLPATVNNLTTSNAAGVTLSNPVTVNGTLSITSGSFSNSGNTIAGGTGSTISIASGATLTLTTTSSFPSGFDTETLTGTVNFGGSSQTVANKSYTNLTLSGSGTKTLAATTSVSGDLEVNAVTVDMTVTPYTLNVTGNYTNKGSVIYSNGGTLDVNGNFTNNASATLNLGSTAFNIAGTWTNSGTAAIAGTGTVTFDGSGAQTVSGTTDFATNSIPVVIANSGSGVQMGSSTNTFKNITLNASSVLTANSNNFSLTGDWTNNGGTFTGTASNSVTFNGGSTQTIGGSATTTFEDVACSGAGTKTLGINTTVNGTLSPNASTIDFAGFTLTVGGYSNTGAVTFSNGGTLDLNGNFTNNASASLNLGSTAFNIAGTWTNSGTAAISGTGTVTFDGSGAQTVSGTTDFATNSIPVVIANSGSGVQMGSSTNTFGNITLNASSVLTANSNDFSIKGDWTNNGGTFTGTAGNEVIFNGTVAQSITGSGQTTFEDITVNNSNATPPQVTVSTSNINIHGVLDVNDGQLSTGGLVTFTSDASGTGVVADLSNGTPEATAITGNVTVQRYLNEDSGGPSWCLLASPVTGVFLEDWDDDAYTTGITSSDDPTFWLVSMSTWDEATMAFPTPGDMTTEALNRGADNSGWFVYNTSTTFDLTGSLGAQGTVTMSGLSENGSDYATTNTGWHLLGNPYQANVPWDNTALTNIDGASGGSAFVIKNDGSGDYVEYNHATSSNVLSAGEGFWVRVADGFTGTVEFAEIDKSGVATDDNYNIVKYANPNIALMKIQMEVNGDGRIDEAKIAIRENASLGYEYFNETSKLGNANGLLNIFTRAGNNRVAFNSLPDDTANLIIPIETYREYGVWSTTDNYTLTFEDVSNFKDNNKCLVLEDSVLGTFTPITTDGQTYSYTADDTDPRRLFLHISTPVRKNVTSSGCNALGGVVATGEGNGPFNYTWLNDNLDTVKVTTGSTTADTLKNLSTGFYTVEISGNGTCGTMKAKVEIESKIVAEIVKNVDFVCADQAFWDRTPVRLEDKNFLSRNQGEMYKWFRYNGTKFQLVDQGINKYYYDTRLAGTYFFRVVSNCGGYQRSVRLRVPGADCQQGIIFSEDYIIENEEELVKSADFETEVVDINEGYTRQATISVSPNPFKNNITVFSENMELNGGEIRITDVLGKTVATNLFYSSRTGNSSTVISTNHLETGVYFYQVFSKEGELIESDKLIKN